jgi:hypothetical protein
MSAPGKILNPDDVAKSMGIILSDENGIRARVYQRAIEIGKDAGYCRLLGLPVPEYGVRELTDNQLRRVYEFVIEEFKKVGSFKH